LGPGDVLDIRDTVMGSIITTGRILSDGTLNLPMVGRVHLAGLSLAQARAALNERYARYFTEPHLTVRIVRQHPIRIYIAGAVANPGMYISGKNLQPEHLAETVLGQSGRQFNFYKLYLTDALILGGGLKANANVRDITIHRNIPKPDTLHINLMAIFDKGDTLQDIPLHDQDAIEVDSLPAGILNSEAENQVQLLRSNIGQENFKISVLGAVGKPGQYKMNRENTVLDAIAKAGGFTASASRKKIFVLHTTSQGQLVKHELNLQDKKLVSRQPIQEWAALLPDDIVFVDESETKKATQFGLNLMLDRASSAALFPVFNALFSH
jgi:polysaccharide export outer membrane protein